MRPDIVAVTEPAANVNPNLDSRTLRPANVGPTLSPRDNDASGNPPPELVSVPVRQDLAGLVQWLDRWWGEATLEQRHELVMFLINKAVEYGGEAPRW